MAVCMNDDTPWKIPPCSLGASLRKSTSKKQRFEANGDKLKPQKTPMTPLKREKFRSLDLHDDIIDFAYSPFRIAQTESRYNHHHHPENSLLDNSMGVTEVLGNPFFSSPTFIDKKRPQRSQHVYLWKSDNFRILRKEVFSCLPFPFVPYTNEEESGDTISYLHANYQIIEHLGEGTFADVFKVRHNDSGEVFAMKMGKKPFSGIIDRGRRLREVAHLWQVKGCPNCLQIHEAWEQKGILFIVTELCENGTLKEVIDYMVSTDARFTEYQVWQLLGQLAAGLQSIHSKQIAHLDLKPANILIDSKGILKIGDFGVSVSVDADHINGNSSKDGDMEGDKFYLAPETLDGTFDTPADIFSLGLLIFEISTGECLPSQGSSWRNLRIGDFSNLALDEVPKSLHQLILAMTDPDPSRRPKISEILHLFNLNISKSELVDKE